MKKIVIYDKLGNVRYTYPHDETYCKVSNNAMLIWQGQGLNTDKVIAVFGLSNFYMKIQGE